MFNLESNCSVYLIPGYTDMRKGILTLSQLANSIVDNKFFSGSLFIFCSKRKYTLKIVYWDMNGFCMWQKKLDKDITFAVKFMNAVGLFGLASFISNQGNASFCWCQLCPYRGH